MAEAPLESLEEALARVGQAVELQLGLNFAPAASAQLRAGLEAAAPHFGCEGALACARWLLGREWSESEKQCLAEHLAIGESYFFRDDISFGHLEERILPPLIEQRRASGRRLRVWSAGCSTGEEPYSIAMLLAALIPDWREWNLSVLATDINGRALAKAREGVYSGWSFRSALASRRGEFLIRHDNGLQEVDPAIRRLVSFQFGNLADFSEPALHTMGMDLILCRNVLIYFKPARALSVLERLGRSLADDGWLLTSPVEVPLSQVAGLSRVELPATVALRRSPQAAWIPLEPVQAEASGAPTPRSRVGEPIVSPLRAAEPAAQWSAAPDTRWAVLARTHADKGDLVHAAALCSKAIENEQGNADLRYLMGTICYEQGALDEAALAFRRALELNPSHVLAHFALGGIARRRGDVLTSQRHLSAVLAELASLADEDPSLAGSDMSARQLETAIRAMGVLR